jgi:hypothetical protein
MNANTDYTDLIDATTTNNELTAIERETHIQWSAKDDRAIVFTEEKHIARRLLANPEFEMESYKTSGDATVGKEVQAHEYETEGHDKRKPVYGVRGTIPVRLVSIKPSSPKGTGHAPVVTAKWLKQLREEGEVDV